MRNLGEVVKTKEKRHGFYFKMKEKFEERESIKKMKNKRKSKRINLVDCDNQPVKNVR